MQTVNKQTAREGRSGGTCPATLERGKLVTVAVVRKAPLEGEGGPPPHMNSKKKKRWQLQKAGRAVYWRKQKGRASRRTLNKQSLQQQMADSRSR
jgi:hypothetical protein